MSPHDFSDERLGPLMHALEGWCTAEKAIRLARLAQESQAELCVELGVFGARSLIAIATGLARNGRGRVDGIDPYTKDAAIEGRNDPENDKWWTDDKKVDLEVILRGARAALERAGVNPFARIILARSQDSVSGYQDGSIDLLHQDSNHSEEVSCAEVIAWSGKVRPGGHWVSDDTHWVSTQRAQALLIGCGFEPIEDHDTWRIFRKRDPS